MTEKELQLELGQAGWIYNQQESQPDLTDLYLTLNRQQSQLTGQSDVVAEAE